MLRLTQSATDDRLEKLCLWGDREVASKVYRDDQHTDQEQDPGLVLGGFMHRAPSQEGARLDMVVCSHRVLSDGGRCVVVERRIPMGVERGENLHGVW